MVEKTMCTDSCPCTLEVQTQLQ